MTEKLTWDSLNLGDYISAAEFTGQVTMTIAGIERVDFEKEKGGHEKRGVVSFKETDRRWVTNKTNVQLMRAIWPEMEGAIGHRITLASEMVAFGAEKVPGIRVVGSPEMTAPINAIVKLPRKKARTVRLVPTVRSGGSIASAPAPAPVAPTSGPLTLRCTGCGVTVPASVDATADDLVGVCCNECGADMAVSS